MSGEAPKFELLEYHEGRNLHVFLPSSYAESEKIPLILFFPGGGWLNVDPKMHYAQCYLFAKLSGAIACAVEYTNHGISALDIIMEDAARACAFCQERFKDKLGQVCVMGNSAGGQISAALVLSQMHNSIAYKMPDLAVLFAPALNLHGIITDFIKLTEETEIQNLYKKVQKWDPVANLTSGCPPFLIFHGTNDQFVNYKYTSEFIEKSRALGNTVVCLKYDGYDHRDFYVNNPYTKFSKDAYERANGFGSSEIAKKEERESPNNIFIESLKTTQHFLVDKGFLKGPKRSNEEILTCCNELTAENYNL